MLNVIPPNHVEDVPVVEPDQHDDIPVVLELVLVDEDEDPEEDEFEEEEDPQEEEDDIEVDIEEDENEPKLTYPYEEMDPFNPSSHAFVSKPKDAIEVENLIEHEDETIPANVYETAFLSRRLCGRETVHALVEKKGKAKDEFYGKLILDLGNEVHSSVEQGTVAMEKLVEKLGNAEDKVDSAPLTQAAIHRMIKDNVDAAIAAERARKANNNQRQGNARAMVTAPTDGRLHLCECCFTYHVVQCMIKCCKEKNVATGENALPIPNCYDCGEQGHTRNRCPMKVKQEKVGEVRGRSYAIKDYHTHTRIPLRPNLGVLQIGIKSQETVMSDSEDSTVTYTEVSSPFDDLSDIGFLGVDGLPMMPHDSYAYVEAALQPPPSPDYDDVLIADEQPLPAAVSLTADSPGYIPEFYHEEDPEEDVEEDPADYPTNREDDDKEEESSRDEADDEEEDDDEDEEEEEHPALADSIPPLVHHVTVRMSVQAQTPISLPLETEVSRLLAIPTPPPSPLSPLSSPLPPILSPLPHILSPPLHISPPPLPASPTYPLGYRAAMIKLRAESTSTSYPPPPIVLPKLGHLWPYYIPGPEYPEYLPPADDVLLAKEQPLPAAVSPTAKGDDDADDDGDDLSEDDDDDEDEEESSDSDEEEEEHLAPTVPALALHKGIPEADMLLRKRTRFTTPTGGYEVGKSSVAAAARGMSVPYRDSRSMMETD
nr:hypothetical protein [Tanacetum cinerariifolium]